MDEARMRQVVVDDRAGSGPDPSSRIDDCARYLLLRLRGRHFGREWICDRIAQTKLALVNSPTA